MKKYITHTILALAFVIVGCEGAKAPMGEPTEIALNSDLLGTWTGINEADEEESFLTISALNNSEYTLVYEEAGDEPSEIMNLKAFASSVGGIQFANISCSNCEEDEQEEWFFFAFELDGEDALLIRGLDDDVYTKGLKDLTHSAQIRSYIESHLTEVSFFEEGTARFERKKD